VDASDPLSQLAADVADGKDVAWDSVKSDTAGDLDSVAELRIIDAIARLHRRSQLSGGSVPELFIEPSAGALPPGDSPAIFEWGSLRVLERVGAGSFGEVFRAWDTTLDREVALKLLSHVPSARTRVAALTVREGQMLARVRHPNVMTVHGAQEIDGKVGIWGEFLRGRTLANMVAADGPFNAQEASGYSESVCRALTAVHRAGLLHRDVKAQNVMREYGGRIVLMDFGLGRDATKASNDATGGLELAGTPPYLAPELFLGKPASVRSDVYSVGVLLFFLVTGVFPVDGRSLGELAEQHAARRRRRLQDLRSDLPSTFVQVVERALSQDETARYSTAGALESALARTTLLEVSVPASTARHWQSVAALLVLVLLMSVWGLNTRRSAEAPLLPVSFTLTPPPNSRFAIGTRNVAVVSLDGRRVAYVAGQAGQGYLWWRSLADQKDTMIQDSRGAVAPFWSPDGESLGFFTQGGLQLASISGARSEIKTALWEQRGGSWSSRGDILLARSRRDALYLLDQNKTLTPVTTVDRAHGEIGHLWPQFLPDGAHFIYYVASAHEDVRGIYLSSLNGGKPTKLVATDASGAFGSGFLLFIRSGALYAQALDIDRGVLTGTPRKIAPQVDATWDGRGAMSVSETGVLAYAPIKDKPQLIARDIDDPERQTVIADAGKFRNPAMSRDGKWLVLQKYEDSISSLWRIDLHSNSSTSLRYVTGNPECPVSGPDGQVVYSAASAEGWQDLYVSTGDRFTAPIPLITGDGHDKLATDWSADGRFIAYMVIGQTGDYDLWIATVPTASNSIPQRWPIVERPGVFEANAKFSPNSRWLAFTSNENDQHRLEVYVTPLSSDGRVHGKVVQVSETGGYDPSWSNPDTLVYLDGQGRLMERRLADGPTLSAPRRLLDINIATLAASRNNYVLRPFDRRAVFVVPLPELEEAPFHVIVNWPRLPSLLPERDQ
jgi:serine/threonine protein kinase